MAKHLLFLIHGMGVHGNGWSEEPGGPVEALKKASEKYAYFRKTALVQKVEFVPITYDDVFREIVEAWQKDAAAINEYDKTGLLQGSLSWLASAGEQEKNFFWSHVADVALYRCSPLYRQRVRTHVIDQIASRIEAAFNADKEATCSVLAHSLGTAVAHDSIHLLGTVRWGDKANPLSPAHWRFNHFFMVANTSRLLQSEDQGDDYEMKKAYESIVRPGPLTDPSSYCATYWNFRHEVDPVPFPRMFEPAGWKDYSPVVVRHVWEPNIHGLNHYLLNPRVHIPILKKLVSSKAVTDEEAASAVNPDNFPQFGGKFADVNKAKKFILRLEEFKLKIGEDPAPTDLFSMLVKMFVELGKEIGG